MMDVVIECPECGKQDCIQVLVVCSIPVEVDDYDNGAASWAWDEAEAVGVETKYECWQCEYAWPTNGMTADDFVKEYKSSSSAVDPPS
jgi:hypothetical protein